MKIAVIGAGYRGLLVIKHAKAAGFDVTCFEKQGSVGGLWTNEKDTAMYKNLRTNLPKELMGFRDYPFTGPTESFVTRKEVLDFINRFATYFNLIENILFYHEVKSVKLFGTSTGKWEIITENSKTHSIKIDIYDAIFVCNGKYWSPSVPKIKGNEYFKGKILHSSEYKIPETFKDQRLLVIGSGPSGCDIANDAATAAKHVYLSQHSNRNFKEFFPSNVSIKPDVAEVTKTGTIKFIDDSEVSIDSILLCTGYNYSFPFLTPECGIKVHENHVQKLFMHLINIENPTMFFTAIVFPRVSMHLMDLQVRFCIKFLKYPSSLPSKEEMLKDYEKDLHQRKNIEKLPSKKMHMVFSFEKMRAYFEDLEKTADLEPTDPVILKLTKRVFYLIENDYIKLRRNQFKIKNKHEFEEVYVEDSKMCAKL